ncbi:MAG: branched-chain amino acid ABC transporter permease [Nitrospinota bacterium]|nr:MAG: branched-chain amino acid ABC transporter permease [Nitrospinota bacterium]
MEYILLQAMNGLVVGMIYALAAAGLTVIFSILKIVNFAHGELYMMGAYTAYYAIRLLGIPPALSVLVAMGAMFVLGVFYERLFLTPLYTGEVDRKDEYALIVTFGFALLLQNLAIVAFGPFSKRPPSFLPGAWHWGMLTITYDRLIAVVIAVSLLLLLVAFLHWTAWGHALDAVSQSRESAAIVGINPHRLYTLAFGMGAALAGAAGALIAPIFSIAPTMGVLPAVKSFIIVVLGGMGSVAGSILGGLLIGIGEGLGVGLFPDPGRALAYSNAFGVLILAITLLIRPTGLFGREHLRME